MNDKLLQRIKDLKTENQELKEAVDYLSKAIVFMGSPELKEWYLNSFCKRFGR
jgi:hypothetical protein